MGVILQILGLIITFTMAMEALRRFGIDVGWLNPLAFFRRRAWAKKVETPPLYALEHPVDVVAVMALAMVQATGAVTVEQKEGVLALLRQHLGLGDADANNLWVASSHMLRRRALAPTEVPAVLERSIEKFTDYHVQTLRSVMQGAAQIVPPASAAQQQLPHNAVHAAGFVLQRVEDLLGVEMHPRPLHHAGLLQSHHVFDHLPVRAVVAQVAIQRHQGHEVHDVQGVGGVELWAGVQAQAQCMAAAAPQRNHQQRKRACGAGGLVHGVSDSRCAKNSLMKRSISWSGSRSMPPAPWRPPPAG